MTTLHNIRKNCMGTISFMLKADNMRKPQEFITYPMSEKSNVLNFQSDKRWIVLNLETKMAKISIKGNTYWEFVDNGSREIEINPDDLDQLLTAIKGTSNAEAGKKENGICMTDNSAAHTI